MLMVKGYTKQLYQAWKAAIPDHVTSKLALTVRMGRIQGGKGLPRLNFEKPNSRGVATLTETVEEYMGTQEQGELHHVHTERAEQSGELCTDPAETRTHDIDPSPRTSGNDLFIILGKAKDACLRKTPGDFS